MNKINWTVRLKSKTFWLTVIPALLLLVQVVAAVFGFELDLGDLGNKLLAVVNALFSVLTILGIVCSRCSRSSASSPTPPPQACRTARRRSPTPSRRRAEYGTV